MSDISSLGSHVDEEGEMLRSLSSAVLRIQAAALGDLELLQITQEQVEQARATVLDFLTRLLDALQKGVEDAALQPLVVALEEGPKPHEDWVEDLRQLRDMVSTKGQVPEAALRPIEDVLTLITDDYARSIRALYHGW